MKILIWGLSEGVGGIENFLLNYITNIHNIDESIVFDLIWYKRPVYSEIVEKLGGKVFVIKDNKKEYLENFFSKHANEYELFWYNNVSLTDFLVLKIVKKYNVKRVIVHSHCSSMMSTGIKKYYYYLKHMYNRSRIEKFATDYYACSDRAATWMFPQSTVNNKCRIIPNAIDANAFRYNEKLRELIRFENQWNEKRIIGVIGRLAIEKDIYFAIDVFGEYIKINKRAMLIIIGDGYLRSKLEDYAKKRGLYNDVIFMGIRSDVSRLIQGIDVVLLSSNHEGFPMTLVEAQASGTPVIAAKEATTDSVKLVDNLILKNKSDGVKEWALEIDRVGEKRKNNFEIIVSKNYDLKSASVYMIDLFKGNVVDE